MLKKRIVNSADIARNVLENNGLKVRNLDAAHMPVRMTVEGDSVIIKPRIVKAASSMRKAMVAQRYACRANGNTIPNGRKKMNSQQPTEEEQKPQRQILAKW